MSENSRIPSIDFGGSGTELVFLHANGYPPECYRPLLSRLAENYHVTAMVQRPLWPDSKPDEIEDWLPLTDDFLRYLDAHQLWDFVDLHKALVAVASNASAM